MRAIAFFKKARGNIEEKVGVTRYEKSSVPLTATDELQDEDGESDGEDGTEMNKVNQNANRSSGQITAPDTNSAVQNGASQTSTNATPAASHTHSNLIDIDIGDENKGISISSAGETRVHQGGQNPSGAVAGHCEPQSSSSDVGPARSSLHISVDSGDSFNKNDSVKSLSGGHDRPRGTVKEPQPCANGEGGSEERDRDRESSRRGSMESRPSSVKAVVIAEQIMRKIKDKTDDKNFFPPAKYKPSPYFMMTFLLCESFSHMPACTHAHI